MIMTAPTRPKEKSKAARAASGAVRGQRTRGRRRSRINVQGEARPRVEAALAAQVAGRIVWASPAFVEGGSFREGETLARIEAADYQLAVVRARSQVAQAQEGARRAKKPKANWRARIGQALGRGEPSSLAVREPQLAQARAHLRRRKLRCVRLNSISHARPFARRSRAACASGAPMSAIMSAPASPVAVMFSTDAMEIRVPLTDADLASHAHARRLHRQRRQHRPAAHVSASSRADASALGKAVSCAPKPRSMRARASSTAWCEVREPVRSAPFRAARAGHVRVGAASKARRARRWSPRRAARSSATSSSTSCNADNTIDVRQVRAAQTTADEVLFREGVADGERVVVSVLTSPREGMAVTPIDRAGTAAQRQRARDAGDAATGTGYPRISAKAPEHSARRSAPRSERC